MTVETPPLTGLTIPRHVAIIMDGNGRWARQQGLRRLFGHEEGAESVRSITRECARLGVQRLTLYAFSADNWKRPAREVSALMKLLKRFLVNERREIMDNNIRFSSIGRTGELPGDVREELGRTIELSRKNTGMVLCLALNYGGRNEIVDAMRRIAGEVKRGTVAPEAIDAALVARYLYDPDALDPDLLIRTGGEVRVSDFLLWQIQYTELWVTPVMWPDFREDHLHEALREFSRRNRRFGGVQESEA